MTVTLITGANRGLGFETAKQLVKAGHDVWLCGRDEARAREAAAALGCRHAVLDVTSEDSVRAAVAAVAAAGAGLDAVVNNAGVLGDTEAPGEVPTLAALSKALTTNLLGPAAVLRAAAPLLDASACPVVVNVSSTLGSLGAAAPGGVNSAPGAYPGFCAYSVSKAALNMLGLQVAKAHPRWRVNSVCPGLTATDMSGHKGHPVETGAEIVVKMALVGADGPTATFVDRNGPVAW